MDNDDGNDECTGGVKEGDGGAGPRWWRQVPCAIMTPRVGVKGVESLSQMEADTWEEGRFVINREGWGL